MINTELRERLLALHYEATHDCRTGECRFCAYNECDACDIERFADHLIANGVTVNNCARPLEEWHEDCGDVLWWKFPIEEPPYVGSPLDANWSGYHTHWTPFAVPEPPKGETNDANL